VIPVTILGARSRGMRKIVVEDHKKWIEPVKQLHYSLLQLENGESDILGGGGE
jgi:hypothetical protein